MRKLYSKIWKIIAKDNSKFLRPGTYFAFISVKEDGDKEYSIFSVNGGRFASFNKYNNAAIEF